MHLTIEDNGCGMTEEVLSISTSHSLLVVETAKDRIGLVVTYRIVQDHGGTIEAFSDGPGRGSRFQLTLPLEPESGAIE